MTPMLATQLHAVDSTMLTPLVRRALNHATITVVDWDYEPVAGGLSQALGQSHGIYRFRGTACAQDTTVSWSLILKITRGPATRESDVPAHAHYWKREVLAYQSGLLTNLPSGIRAPHCFGVVEYPANEWWIWLEDIPHVDSAPWSLEHYRLAAQQLGQFNGAYLVGRALPAHDWLSSGRVRDWLAWTASVIPDLRTLSQRPLVRRWLHDAHIERILSLWAVRESLLAALDRMPRSLCHHDAFRRNLIMPATGTQPAPLIAIDWAFLGTGVLGEELVPLVTISLNFLELPMSHAQDVDAVAFAGYMQGLAAAGWQGNAQLVRFGYTAAAALFMGLGAIGPWLTHILADDGKAFAGVVGYPIDHLLDQHALLQGYLLDLGDEARTLLPLVP